MKNNIFKIKIQKPNPLILFFTVSLFFLIGYASIINMEAYAYTNNVSYKQLNKDYFMYEEEVSVSLNNTTGGEFKLIPNQTTQFQLIKTKVLYNKEILEEETDERTTHYVLEDGYEITNCYIAEECTYSWAEIKDIVTQLDAEYNNITLPVIYGIVRIESTFCSDAYSSAGCVGLMQLNPYYQQDRMRRLGCTNLFNPEDNLRCGIDYLDTLIGEYGLELGVRVYGVGASNVDEPWAIEHMNNYLNQLYEYMEYYEANY